MVTEAEILDVLRTIPDPELPIGIVDLGIVHNIDVADRGSPNPGVPGVRMPEQTGVPVECDVSIEILPTFVGCPALRVIEEQVASKVGQLAGVGSVRIGIVYDPPWSVERISPAGRQALAELGVTVPLPSGERLVSLGVQRRDAATPAACPFCGSTQTELESAFGPTRCKMIYYCSACGNPFEHLRRLT